MKHRFIAKRYWKDQTTPMGKVDDLAKNYDDVINLSLGDPDLITHELIIDKSYADAKAGHTKYTDFAGDPELRGEICRFYQEEYNMEVTVPEVFVAASGCFAMYLALEAILDDGDEVILQAPFFTPYPQQVELARGIPVELPTYEEEDFQISVERLESLITERTKALVINTPSNPTGSCLTVETMEKIAEIAIKHDLIVIADDIYTSFSYQHPFVPIASLPGMRERTITINSFSKNFTMTGWRIGQPRRIWSKPSSRSTRTWCLPPPPSPSVRLSTPCKTARQSSPPWWRSTAAGPSTRRSGSTRFPTCTCSTRPRGHSTCSSTSRTRASAPRRPAT